MAVTLLIHNVFKKFTVRFYGKFAAKYLLQVPPNLIMRRYTSHYTV